MIKKILFYKKYLKKLIPPALRLQIKHGYGYARVNQITRHHAVSLSLPWGVNVFGAVGGASGLSEASRGVILGLRQAGLPVSVYDLTQSKNDCDAPYRVNLIHANPNQLPELCFQVPKQQWSSRYNIGFWVWEQEELPREWIKYFPLFDEIWTPSEFSASAIRKATKLPVYVVPHIVDAKFDPSIDRKKLKLPESLFLGLVMFDCNSVVERKNPLAAIDVFTQAFADKKDKVGLVFKLRNLTLEIKNELKNKLINWENIFFITEDYPKVKVNSLIRAADVYISLHRAEGFGLVLAEAMSLGTPVIATNWSGNTEFMNNEVACMVDATIKRLDKDYLPFRKGSRWAEPSVEQAVFYLKKLYEDQQFRQELSVRAREHIERKLGAHSISKLIGKRMQEIREMWE